MNILIVGGGELGSLIAESLIKEGHNITIIEKSERKVKRLNDVLDAYVINGDANDVNILKSVQIDKTDLFLALTDNDNVNIISCSLVKKISKNKATTIAKVENYIRYFSDDQIEPDLFGIDKVVATKQLSINKICDLISEPDTFDNIYFIRENTKIIGVQISENFSFLGSKLMDISSSNDIWNKVRIVAMKKKDDIIIPVGSDTLEEGDKLYIIGKNQTLKELISSFFATNVKISNVIVIGGNRIGKEFAARHSAKGVKVTIIEEDAAVCSELSESLDNVLIIQGTGTNQTVLSELDIKNSFVVCVTGNDEHNMISAVLAKKHGAYKAICNISNIAVSSIINQLKDIDSVFSTESLALAEIMRYCRSGDILSIVPIPDINAETIKIKISDELPILDTPLKDVKFPKGMIIGAIIRNDKMIIPHGNDEIKMDDVIIAFVLPDGKTKTEKLFSRIITKK